MAEIKRYTIAEWYGLIEAQGVPSRRHVAFKCPMCQTIQSMESLMRTGMGEELAERRIGFSCIGRYTDDPPSGFDHPPPGRGCDWTLGGLMPLHKVEVVGTTGKVHPVFELASTEEALKLMEALDAASEDAVETDDAT